MLRRLFFILLITAFLTGLVFAQSDGTTPGGTGNDTVLAVYNIAAGVIISFAVHALKKWRFFNDYPKLSAAIISIVATVVPVLASAPWASKGVGLVALSFVTQLVAAIGTHETVTKPAVAAMAAKVRG